MSHPWDILHKKTISNPADMAAKGVDFYLFMIGEISFYKGGLNDACLILGID